MNKTDSAARLEAIDEIDKLYEVKRKMSPGSPEHTKASETIIKIFDFLQDVYTAREEPSFSRDAGDGR